MARKCSICKETLSPGSLPEIDGHEGSVELKVHRLPVLECPNGHLQFTHPDFPLLLLDHLLERDESKLPVSATKGVLFKHHHCASCGQALGDAAELRHTFRMDVDLPDTAPFDVDLTVPVHRCSRCGHEQLHSLKDVRSRTPAALAHAFKAAAIVAPA